MTIKHNNQVPHNHFHKDWQRRVRMHFDQPGRKSRRRNNRIQKAAKVAPRPVDKLRPVVRCPTIKYNRRVRPGRGFTLMELKTAGIPRKFARTVGISVDPRRQNFSEESLKVNVERLKDYKKRLILFPRKAGKPKNGDSSMQDIKSVRNKEGIITSSSAAMPITNTVEIAEGKISDYPGEENAFRKLRIARSDARLVGPREKRAKAKADEAAASKK